MQRVSESALLPSWIQMMSIITCISLYSLLTDSFSNLHAIENLLADNMYSWVQFLWIDGNKLPHMMTQFGFPAQTTLPRVAIYQEHGMRLRRLEDRSSLSYFSSQ